MKQKPPLGKPKINHKSKKILNRNPSFEKNTWNRMEAYCQQMKVNKAIKDAMYSQRVIEVLVVS
jgi:hypothetical protein